MTMPMRFRSCCLVLLALLAALPASHAAAQMRFVDYNCARLNGDTPSFQLVIEALIDDDKPGFATAPWVFVFQEVPSTIVGQLLTRLNTAAPPGVTYAQATYTTSTAENNSAGAIALFYRSDKLVEDAAAHVDIPTGANRNCDRWKLKLLGYNAPEVSFYVYGMHLKAENTPEDAATRNAAAVAIRANANTLPAGAKIIYCGDMNLYTNSEAAYQTFTAIGNGRGIDSYGNGSWAGSGNAIKHTQAPCNSGCLAGLVGGGLDDRFDFIFYTDALNNTTGLGRIVGTYRAFGNDGQHYNTAINSGNNFYYPGDIVRSNQLADVLFDASDHIPVVLDFRLPAYANAQMASTIGPVIVGAPTTVPVTISNLVIAPPIAVDELNYTAFGTGALSGGAVGNVGPVPDSDIVNLPLDTSTAGVLACGATVLSTGQDVQNDTINLNASATVLRHAVASFSTKMPLDEGLISVRFDANTGVQNINVPVYNLGYDALQAKLDLDGISSSTPPFGFTGGLASNIAGAPGMLSFTFDTTGLSRGHYLDAVTIDVSDENLPGEIFGQLTLDFDISINPRKKQPCVGDIVDTNTFSPPADGIVDGADLAYLLGEWGPNPGSLADFVDTNTFMPPPDGIVDGADLAVLLGAWGACD